MRSLAPALLALAASLPAAAAGLTRDDVIRLARERAPAVAAAQARVDAARALASAARPSPEASSVELAAGPRYAASTTADAEVSLEIPLDGGARRQQRTSAADAEVRAAELGLEDAQRLAAAGALAEWFRALHADAVAGLWRERAQLARELLDATRERERAGDVARLDVNAAEIETARADSEVASEAAAPLAARARLAALLALDADAATPDGSLGERDAFSRLASQAISSPDQIAPVRADVRAAQATVALAEAEVALARQGVKPPPALRLTAMREEDADILQAGVVLSFASPARARGATQAAAARREAAKAAADATSRAAEADIAAARARLQAAETAAAILEEHALAPADENARLAQEGYEAGKFGLSTTLVMRRDALEARREHLDRLLDAALAAVELWAAVGAPDLGDPS